MLVEERSRVIASLQTDLQADCPCLLTSTKDIDNLWFLNLLSHGQDLQKLARLRENTILGIPAIGRTFGARIIAWQKGARFSHDVDRIGPMIIEDARRILELRRAIKVIETACKDLMKSSRIVTLIDTIPGLATVFSSELVGEIGTLERFERESSLAMYLGMANLSNDSGQIKSSNNPGHIIGHAKGTMMAAVDKHRKLVPESKRYYDKERAEGKKHNQAIRALGRHLCRVIFSMPKHDRGYGYREENMQNSA